MPITLKFGNGNEVDIYPKQSTGLFTLHLNNRSKKTKVSADELAFLLYKLRSLTCVVDDWRAFTY